MVTNFFANPQTDGADALLDRLRVSTAGLYDVAGEIGRGGMAVVYIATDMRLGRKVAIKVMEPRLSFTPGMAERFLQEARIAARLQHHNIIVVHEVQQNEELIFFVMRLVEGGSLDEICRRLAGRGERVPLDQAQWILWQTARALAYAHSDGIVHRDVKPANILVTTKGEVVVTDFGIARAADAEGLTKSGMAIGTPTYMSPEQFTGGNMVSGATDQYALGVAAYELLTGAPPFTGDLYQLIAAHGNTAPTDLRALRPDCPAPLAEAVMRMLEKRTSDRWPSLDSALPVLGAGLNIDGGETRAALAVVASELQSARAASVPAWGAAPPATPVWSSGSRRRVGTKTASISISPPNGRLVAGDRLALRAVVTDDAGATLGDAVVTWTSSDPTVAIVSSEGAVTALAVGSAVISAVVQVGGPDLAAVQASASLEVTPREAARVRIIEGAPVMECGEALRLSVEVTDGRQALIADAEVQWSSSRPDVLHVDGRGTIMALAGGVATLTARVGSVQTTTRIEVREAPVHAVSMTLSRTTVEEGDLVPVVLTVTDASGLPRSTAGLALVSEQPLIAEVQTEPLAIVARGPGLALLRVVSVTDVGDTGARSREPWASAELVVRPVVASVRVRLPTSSVTVGDECAAEAEALDARGETMPDAPLQWRSSDERVATVSTSGHVRALMPGAVRVAAVCAVREGEVQGEALLAVRAVALASLRLSSPATEIVVGLPTPCRAVATDVRGRDTSASLNWSVHPASAGTISPDGVVIAAAPGPLTVTATARAEPDSSPVEATLELSARPPQITALALTVPRGPIRIGQRAQLSVAVRLEGSETNSPAPARADFQWSSSNAAVLTTSASGEVSAVSAGTATVTVIHGALRDSIALQVRAARSPALVRVAGLVALAFCGGVGYWVMRGSDGQSRPASVAIGAAAQPSRGASGAVGGSSPSPRPQVTAAPAPEVATQSTTPAVPESMPPVRPPSPTVGASAAPKTAAGVTVARATPSTARAATVAPAASPPAMSTRADSGIVSAPPSRVETVGPTNDDMRALAMEYAAKLNRGDYRTGPFASFFSRTTSDHRASLVGPPRVAGRSGDAMLVDVDVLVERTLGSGAPDPRSATVRLVLRGRPGAALIESATPGVLARSR